MAKEMLYNKITESGGVRSSPMRAKKRNRESISAGHQLMTRPKYAAAYDRKKKQWGKSKQEYCKQKCSNCPRDVRTYCTCDIGLPMCNTCFTEHAVAMSLRDA